MDGLVAIPDEDVKEKGGKNVATTLSHQEHQDGAENGHVRKLDSQESHKISKQGDRNTN